MFGQLAGCKSLKDIILVLRSVNKAAYHPGIPVVVDSSSLSNANDLVGIVGDKTIHLSGYVSEKKYSEDLGRLMLTIDSQVPKASEPISISHSERNGHLFQLVPLGKIPLPDIFGPSSVTRWWNGTSVFQSSIPSYSCPETCITPSRVVLYSAVVPLPKSVVPYPRQKVKSRRVCILRSRQWMR